MANRRVLLSALVAARLGLEQPTKAVWMPRTRPPYVSTRRARGAFVPTEMEMGITADVVVEDPREPRIEPLGILDARGQMLCRVTVPIKAEIGFVKRRPPVLEEVSTIVAEDMLAVSDVPGTALGFVDESEIEDGDDLDDGEPA